MNCTIEICFSPVIYPHKLTQSPFITVVVDILRATTSITAAFDNGVREVIPVARVDEARAYKEKGFLVASEREGKTLDFADFGNSAFNFMIPEVRGKTIAYSTTNGTQSIALAQKDAEEVALGAFNNLSAVARWLEQQQKNVVVLCSGYKNTFNIEDSLFAGALAQKLMSVGFNNAGSDAVTIALDMWADAKSDPLAYIKKGRHIQRLRQRRQDDVLLLHSPSITASLYLFCESQILDFMMPV